MIGVGYVVKTPFGYVRRILQYEPVPMAEVTENVEEARMWELENIAERVTAKLKDASAIRVATKCRNGVWYATEEPAPREPDPGELDKVFRMKF